MKQIAIDGPAGAGKSTAAKRIAKRLGIHYLDTGAMYRAMAYALLQRGIEIGDHAAVRRELETIDVSVEYVGMEQHVFANKEDVTAYLRTPAVSKGASDVAVIPEVRVKLVKTQRKTAKKYDIVMDGRDIGTYVLPDAPVKFYITATAAERAKRRQEELAAAGIESDAAKIEAEILARDKTDSSREFAPLRQAEDAILLDTTFLSIEEVEQRIAERIAEVYKNGN